MTDYIIQLETEEEFLIEAYLLDAFQSSPFFGTPAELPLASIQEFLQSAIDAALSSVGQWATRP